MQLQIKRLDNLEIEYYKDTLKDYIEDLIKPYTEKNVNEEVKGIYDNMKIFTLDNSAIILGAFNEKKLVGFIWGYKKKEKPNVLHINYFYINEKYRKHGIGKKLLDAIESMNKDIDELELLVDKINESAIRFYIIKGFQISENDGEKFKLINVLKA